MKLRQITRSLNIYRFVNSRLINDLITLSGSITYKIGNFLFIFFLLNSQKR